MTPVARYMTKKQLRRRRLQGWALHILSRVPDSPHTMLWRSVYKLPEVQR